MGFDKDGKEIDPFEAEIERIMRSAVKEEKQEKFEEARKVVLSDDELKDCLEERDGVWYTKNSMTKFIVMMTLCRDILGKDVTKAILDTSKYNSAEEYANTMQDIIVKNMEEIAINAISSLIATHVDMQEYLKNRGENGNKED